MTVALVGEMRAWDRWNSIRPKWARRRSAFSIVAYNAASTLAAVLDRIPPDFRPRISEVIVSDDHSQDSTYLVGLGYQQMSDLPITLIRQPRNLGYGGNQKAGYQVAIDHGLDIVVMLHGDGQYAPECLPEVVAPLLADEADAVFGSRIMIKGAARKGGMPLYKYVGNRILTKFENAALGTDLTEFHSGYRAYSVDALKQIPFEQNSDGFNFDTQIIIQLHDAGKHIVEVPIPTYYGDEICYVAGLRYAADVTKDVIAYRLAKAGFGDGSAGGAQRGVRSSRTATTARTGGSSPCSGHARRGRSSTSGARRGRWPSACSEPGHHVTGVDMYEIDGVHERVGVFVQADLDQGIPTEVGTGFDIVLCADVLEHVRRPQAPAARGRSRSCAADGTAVVCVPNIAHWYPAVPVRHRRLRLRPAGHPRPHAPALLHPPQHPPAGRARRLQRAPARARRPTPRRPEHPGCGGQSGCGPSTTCS